MITYHGTIDWDLTALSAALQISENATQEYFTDGRRISFLLERRLATEVFHGRIADSEKAGYDLIDGSGNRYEVRCVTRSGVYFSPSYMVGFGRAFDKHGFLKKLSSIHGYALCDIIKFPKIPCWSMTSDDILELYNKDKLGKRCMLYRNAALRMLNSPNEFFT
ncbi:MAG: hypothetical protein OXU85_07360 [Thaumarchaeota archaeon]|nr:hypothetical protein [Nitrososphaerota archaeon]